MLTCYKKVSTLMLNGLQMRFNITKCCYHSSQVYHFTNNYFLHGTLLQYTDDCQYLGVAIQSNLKCDSHIHQKIAAANSTFGLLRRNITVSSVDTKALAYKSLVSLNLNALAQYNHPSFVNNVEKVQCMHNAARNVCNVYDLTYSVTSLIRDLLWESLEAYRIKASFCMFYNMINYLADILYYQYTTAPTVASLRNQHNYNLRNTISL